MVIRNEKRLRKKRIDRGGGQRDYEENGEKGAMFLTAQGAEIILMCVESKE